MVTNWQSATSPTISWSGRHSARSTREYPRSRWRPTWFVPAAPSGSGVRRKSGFMIWTCEGRSIKPAPSCSIDCACLGSDGSCRQRAACRVRALSGRLGSRDGSLSIRSAIVEASVWGTTVESAATARVQKIIDEGSLLELTQAVERCLLAGLPEALDGLLATLTDKAALDADVVHLMDALPALARAQRYGDVRRTDTPALGKVERGAGGPDLRRSSEGSRELRCDERGHYAAPHR